MDKKLIYGQGYNKYVRISLPKETTNTVNADFDELLKFIGKYIPYKDKDPIPSAYMAIRKKTNQLLGLDWKNRILRTSKREIASLRFYYKTNDSEHPLFLKMPYKLAYIFKAIILLVDEAKSKGAIIPRELAPLINKTYRLAFYNEQTKAYDAIKARLPIDAEAQHALNGDLHNANSPLNQIFEWGRYYV